MNPNEKMSRELDEQLRTALRADDAELLARLDTDPGIFDTVRAGFRGRNAWWVYATTGVQIALVVIAIWTGVNFFGAESVDDRVLWGIPMMLTVTMTGSIKMIVWSHVERAMLRREIKRVELQVATLSLSLKARE
ncbi:MAG: hypothetical protein ACI8UD_000361 [Planctomycetota bacterium]|jgi:hypothetical protein